MKVKHDLLHIVTRVVLVEYHWLLMKGLLSQLVICETDVWQGWSKWFCVFVELSVQMFGRLTSSALDFLVEANYIDRCITCAIISLVRHNQWKPLVNMTSTLIALHPGQLHNVSVVAVTPGHPRSRPQLCKCPVRNLFLPGAAFLLPWKLLSIDKYRGFIISVSVVITTNSFIEDSAEDFSSLTGSHQAQGF